MNKVIRELTSVVLSGAMMITAVFTPELVNISGGSDTVYAASSGKYVSALAVSYKGTKEKAQEELGDEYTILDKDFNEGMSGHVWIGYKTTDDENYAITDIKAMNMNGGFSYSDYEELLNEQKSEVKDQIDTLIPVLTEYAENYDSGLPAAVKLYDSLKLYYEDDSQMNMGDFLLDVGRALEKNSADETALEKIETVFLQGNDIILTTIENILAMGIDTSVEEEGSWITRMSDIGPEGLTEIYKQSYPKLSNKKIQSKIKSDNSDDATVLLSELSNVREQIKAYEESELYSAFESEDQDKVDDITDEILATDIGSMPAEGDDTDDFAQSIEKSFNAVDETSEVNNLLVTSELYYRLKSISYGDETMYDFFMRDNLTESDLYTMAYVLSTGQKSIVSDIGLYGVFEGMLAEDVDADSDEAGEIGIEAGSISVYENVDRSVFEGDTAITAEALKRMSTAGNDSTDMLYDFAGVTVGLLMGGVAAMRLVMETSAKTETKFISRTVFMQAEWKSAALELEKQAAKETSIIFSNKYAFGLWQIKTMNGIPGFNPNYASKNLLKEYKKAFSMLSFDDRVLTEQLMQGYEGVWKNSSAMKAGRATEIANMKEALKKNYTVNRRAIETTTVKGTSIGSRIFTRVLAVAAVALIGYEIYNIVCEDIPKKEFTDIPLYMVDRSYETDEITYIYYNVAATADGTKADIHNWKGNEWLALYTTTDVDAGDPILVSSLFESVEETQTDSSLSAVTLFGESAVMNLSDKSITGEKMTGAYIFFKNGTASEAAGDEDSDDGNTVSDTESADVTGTVFGSINKMWTLLVLAVAVALVAGFYAGRRWNKSKEG